MDTSGFFRYPTEDAAADVRADRWGLLPAAGPREWALLLELCTTQRIRAGELLYAPGDRDRAVYLLTEGRVVAVGRDGNDLGGPFDAPAVLGELGFFDGGPRVAGVRAVRDGEALRLAFDHWEVLSARSPMLGRELLLDLARIGAARALDATTPPLGWSG